MLEILRLLFLIFIWLGDCSIEKGLEKLLIEPDIPLFLSNMYDFWLRTLLFKLFPEAEGRYWGTCVYFLLLN